MTSWQPKDPYEKVKLHLYRNQLMFYKLLIEHSASYAKKIVVNSGALEFIEPGENGQLIDDLHLDIDPEELRRFTALVEAVWTHIQNLDLPDISAYKKDLSGVEAFEQDLINSPRE